MRVSKNQSTNKIISTRYKNCIYRKKLHIFVLQVHWQNQFCESLSQSSTCSFPFPSSRLFNSPRWFCLSVMRFVVVTIIHDEQMTRVIGDSTVKTFGRENVKIKIVEEYLHSWCWCDVPLGHKHTCTLQSRHGVQHNSTH